MTDVLLVEHLLCAAVLLVCFTAWTYLPTSHPYMPPPAMRTIATGAALLAVAPGYITQSTEAGDAQTCGQFTSIHKHAHASAQ